MAKIISADQAAELLKDNSTVIISGFVGCGHPEALTSAAERRFLKSGRPKNLTLVFSAGQGNGKGLGAEHFAHEGMVKRVIGGHWNWAPGLGRMAEANTIEAYNLPQGTIVQLFRAIAAGQPGVVSSIGLQTFVDPRIEGGKLNQKTTEDLVELCRFDGREYLRYKPFSCDAALLRGTSADIHGNISIEQEAVKLEILSIAQAVHRNGGQVIVQVKKLKNSPIPPREVVIPGMLVDCLVLADENQHMQTYATDYDAAFAGLAHKDVSDMKPLGHGWRRVVAERAYRELPENAIVNLGIGVPEGVAAVAAEKGAADRLTLTVEAGGIGGVPAGGLDFGAVYNASAFLEHSQQFDFYDGGGLNAACLGFAQADSTGNVNVSKFNGRIAGCGGFINITQSSPLVMFCGGFTTGGLETAIEDRKLKIVNEGRIKKFVKTVEQITFSGPYASQNEAKVLFITERAVFELCEGKLMLTEIAPGIDPERDIFSQMEFKPMVAAELRTMPEELFT